MLTLEERLEIDPGVVLPQSTQRLRGDSCDWFLNNIGTKMAEREQMPEMQGFACYMTVTDTPTEFVENFNTAFSAAGYQLMDEKLNAFMPQPENTFQIWANAGGYIFVVTHVYATPDHFATAGLTTTVSLFIDPSTATMDYESEATALAFDPAVALPEGAAQSEGSSCDVSVQNVLGFLDSMGRATDHLTKHRCYLLYTDDWKTSAEEMMQSLENAGYTSERLTSDDFNFPVIVQIWSKAGSIHPLTIYFGESRTGSGLFVVVSRD
jgi:hypothetical protein